MGERRFNDKEMNAIIQRATELQIPGAPDKSGATLSQIQQAASELGISPDLIEKAASEVGLNPGKRKFSFLGRPVVGAASLVAEGELRQEDWPTLLQELRKATGRIGTVRPLGNVFDWVSQSPTGMHLSATPSRGRTHIDIRLDHSPLVGLYFLLPGILAMLVGVLGAKLGGGEIGLVAWFAALTITYCLGRIGFKRSCDQSTERLRVLAEAIANQIEAEKESAPIHTESEPLQLRLTSQ